MCTTPIGLASRMRLARARQDLLQAGPQSSVINIALATGFSQLGRFAAEYRNAFGEPPSRTMRRARRSPTAGGDPDLDEAIRIRRCAEQVTRPSEGWSVPKRADPPNVSVATSGQGGAITLPRNWACAPHLTTTATMYGEIGMQFWLDQAKPESRQLGAAQHST